MIFYFEEVYTYNVSYINIYLYVYPSSKSSPMLKNSVYFTHPKIVELS
jgi:hypothetical protein